MESMQHQLQEVVKRRNDLMPERQSKRWHERYKVSKTRDKLQKESLAAREEMRKIREEIEWKEERCTQLSDKVDKNKMADAETEAELQGLQAGEERGGSNASQAVECCLETMVEQIFALGTGQGMVSLKNAYFLKCLVAVFFRSLNHWVSLASRCLPTQENNPRRQHSVFCELIIICPSTLYS